MKKVLHRLLSMPLMVFSLLLFFIAMGGATFVENDFGTPVAQKWVYQSSWFSGILIYLSISLVFNIYRHRLIQRKKISSLLFHSAFLVIVIGAGLTRYLGFEGAMLIREGASSNQVISADTYLQVKVHDRVKQYTYNMPVIVDTNEMAYVHPGVRGGNPLRWLKNYYFNHNNYFEHAFSFEEKRIRLSCVDVIKNPKDTLVPDVHGTAHIELVTGGANGRVYHYIPSGTHRSFRSGLTVAFDDAFPSDAIHIVKTDTGLYVRSPLDIRYLQMSDQSQGVIVRDSLQPFTSGRLYMMGGEQFVFRRYHAKGTVTTIESEQDKNGLLGVVVRIEEGQNSREVLLKGGKGQLPQLAQVEMNDLHYTLGFGSRVVALPFFIYLKDFQLERYPGTDNPSSFASEVGVVDPEREYTSDFRIFMNHVLDYRGYRFFQSSYEKDEKGTILSVNKDKPGMYATYLGYFLLALGFSVNLFSKNSRFRVLIQRTKQMRVERSRVFKAVAWLLLATSANGYSQTPPVVPSSHAEQFARLIVQDQGGRFKPVHTLALEVMKKVSKTTDWKGQQPTQVFVGLHTHQHWHDEPLIYVSGKELRARYHLNGKYAALTDFLQWDTSQVTYLLEEAAATARRKKPFERNSYDKNVLKTDERINILLGIFNGSYLRLFPRPNDPSDTWYTHQESAMSFKTEDSSFVAGVMQLYFAGAKKGYTTGDWENADKALSAIHLYQQKATTTPLPSRRKLEWEIWYNEVNLFKRLMAPYVLIGLLLLLLQFVHLFAPRLPLKWPIQIGAALFGVLFLLHGLGLGLRWYLSGHAPWSNGYEAVVFIAFVTILAGLLFYRQLKIVLGATGLLACLMLWVAHMNQMDPEMTHLVPVLKSYWLMIHVAIITGSYGFLGLGALLSLMVLAANLFLRKKNVRRLLLLTKELTHVSEMTVTIGLFMLTIGTFLGGVWANESWGRYWGWDAKETWALASVVIYAIVLHLRFIPFMKSQFAFNFWAFWAYSSIIMTFFGVNYYLSGLHSYAQGDPLSIPSWVPVSISSIGLICVCSFLKWRAAKKWMTQGTSS